MPTAYDIAVLGATPAGYVAALTLARQGHTAAVMDCPASRTESPLADWMPAELVRTCPALKAVAKTGTDGPFRAVQFHSADLAREAVFQQRTHAGFVLRRARLVKALEGRARKAGIRIVRARHTVRPELEESSISLGSRPRVRAALLLIAQDSPAEAVASLGLAVRAAPSGRMTVWGIDVPFRSRSPDKALHVVAFEKSDQLGMFFVAGDVLHVRIVATRRTRPASAGPEASDGAVGANALGELIARLQQGGLLPAKLNLGKATAAAWNPPGGAALELESHLAKRTLLIGTAGGFASAMSGQTIDPSVRSALVAAEVVHEALASDGVQEALADYKKRWRDPLADRIRPPGTTLRMLMPMVLSNKAMTARFAKALLYGESL